MIKTEAFFGIDRETLKCILKITKLNCSEKELYKAVILWSNRLCIDMNDEIPNAAAAATGELRRTYVGDAINLIHFPAMDMDSFLQCIKFDENFLTDTEIVMIIKSILAGKNYSKIFPDQKRLKPVTNVESQQIWRHRNKCFIVQGGFSQSPEQFKILSNANIKLKGFFFFL